MASVLVAMASSTSTASEKDNIPTNEGVFSKGEDEVL